MAEVPFVSDGVYSAKHNPWLRYESVAIPKELLSHYDLGNGWVVGNIKDILRKAEEIKVKDENMDIQPVLKERGNRYGEFTENAEVSQALKCILKEGYYGKLPMSYVHKEALDNICQKLARIVCGDPNYEDNWVDIIGYSQLVLDHIRKD